MLERWDPEADGELTEEALRAKVERGGYAAFVYTYPPGTRFPPHLHDEDKRDAVLSGRFEIIVQGESFLLEAGDILAVRRGIVHSARVVGNEPVVSLDATREG